VAGCDLDSTAAYEFRMLYARPRAIPADLPNTSGPILCPPLVGSSLSASGRDTKIADIPRLAQTDPERNDSFGANGGESGHSSLG